MKRSADIAECEFIFNLQQQFDNNEIIQSFFEKLDDDYSDGIKLQDNIERKEIVAYLTFFEMMCNLILKGVLKIDDVDALYAYPFFIAMNNKKVQELELLKYKQFYRNIHSVYPKWFAYRDNNNYEIPYKENRLK